MYAEVIFPLKVKSFTYRLQSDMPPDLIGRIVRAPLGNQSLYGIICDVRETLAFEENVPFENINHRISKVKQIISIHEHFGSSTTISLIKWLSEYYISPLGAALSSYPFKEAIKIIEKFRLPNRDAFLANNYYSNNLHNVERDISLLFNAIQDANYKAFLLHSPSSFYQKSFLRNICEKAAANLSGAIFLVPEIMQIDDIANIMKKIFGERVCSIHSKQGNKKRIEVIKGILSGQHDIIVGTRSAILMPLKKISFIAVLNEHSISYKGEEGLRYNGRDVAIMRGFLEGIPVLLSSICPSIESFNNAKNRKYHLLKPSQRLIDMSDIKIKPFSSRRRPDIEIINMYDDENSGLSISKKVLLTAKKCLSANENMLFIVNKKGYSLITCRDCGYIFKCSNCKTPLIFYKKEGFLRCSKCGQEKRAPEGCNICRGMDLMPLGAGTERINEDISKFLNNEAILIEKNTQKLADNDSFIPFIIGRGHHIRRLSESIFKAVAFIDVDLYFLEPNYRANEKLFQEIIHFAELVKPDGCIYLQTRNPKNRILNFIKNYDFSGFYKNELAIRKEIGFPPFSRLILFNIFLKKEIDGDRNEFQRILSQRQEEGIEILGPIELQSLEKSQIHLRFLIKSKDRKRLNQLASSLKEAFNILKGVRVTTDVDPLRF